MDRLKDDVVQVRGKVADMDAAVEVRLLLLICILCLC